MEWRGNLQFKVGAPYRVHQIKKEGAAPLLFLFHIVDIMG